MLERIKTLLKSQAAHINKGIKDKVALQDPSCPIEPQIPRSIVARQPIFDLKDSIWGYELLYRGPSIADNSMDGSVATASVIVDGYETVTPGLRVGQSLLINFTESLLETRALKLLPAQTCIAEILETTEPTEKVLAALKDLKKSGYRIAVDDFAGQSNLLPFLPLADIVKVDVLQLSPEELTVEALRLRETNTIMLAEKVEDRQTLARCRDLGFTLFQGFFFSRPELVEGRKLSSSHAARMRILNLCLHEEINITPLSEAVLHDPIITARLLKFANSPYFGVRGKVKSIPNALRLIGRVNFLQWICVNMLAAFENTERCYDMSFLASQRAKFLEVLGVRLFRRQALNPRVNPQSLFLVGLFSLIESITMTPIREALEGVPIEPGILAALSGQKSPYLPWLYLINFYEHADWNRSFALAERLKLTPSDLSEAYAQASVWSAGFFPDNK